MKTRDQEYAATIFKQVQDEVNNNPNVDDKQQYGSMAHKLPILIRTSGLVQALQFVDSRGKDPHKLLLKHLAQTVLKSEAPAGKEKEELLTQSRTNDLGKYMLLTQRTMAALLWYKRFAQSLLKVEADVKPEIVEVKGAS